MTGQIDDCFRYDGTKYSVAGISEGQIFDPAWLGLTPVSPCTACWRGYQAIYTVIDRQLVIETLCVSLLGRGSVVGSADSILKSLPLGSPTDCGRPAALGRSDGRRR